MLLSEIVAQIKESRVFANENVEEGPSETLSGRRGRKNQAIEKLTRLTRAYKEEMLKSALFIIVSGSGKDEFSTLASESFGCFATDANAFYQDLSNRVPPSQYLGADIGNAFDVLGRHLEDKMMELGVSEYPQLVFRQQYRKTVKNQDDFTAVVRQAINEQVGAEVVGIQAVNSILSKALDANHTGKVTPIVLTTDDAAFIASLSNDLERLTRRVFTVVAGKAPKGIKSVKGSIQIKEVTAETVGQTMKTINDSLKR